MTTASEPTSDRADDLVERFGGVEEIEVSTRSPGGALRSFVPIWVVALDRALYVRSYRGATGVWYRHATTGGQRVGAIRAGGHHADVTFTHVDLHDCGLLQAISEACREKYARYRDTYLQPMLADQAVAATVRLDPAHDA